jgi:hypothetical protein
MKKLKYTFISIALLFFTACGTESQIDSRKVFDLWNYMTSSANYEVVYNVYENGVQKGQYVETHKQYGDEYQRQSDTGITRLFINPSRILMQEPTGNDITIMQFVYLGDKGIFQSSDIQLCSFDRFYDQYSTQGRNFYNVIQISCTTRSGLYSEYFYAYNEGIVSSYQRDGNYEKEYVKISEIGIF